MHCNCLVFIILLHVLKLWQQSFTNSAEETFFLLTWQHLSLNKKKWQKLQLHLFSSLLWSLLCFLFPPSLSSCPRTRMSRARLSPCRYSGIAHLQVLQALTGLVDSGLHTQELCLWVALYPLPLPWPSSSLPLLGFMPRRAQTRPTLLASLQPSGIPLSPWPHLSECRPCVGSWPVSQLHSSFL